MQRARTKTTLSRSVQAAVESAKHSGGVLRVKDAAKLIVAEHHCSVESTGMIMDALCAQGIRSGLAIEFQSSR